MRSRCEGGNESWKCVLWRLAWSSRGLSLSDQGSWLESEGCGESKGWGKERWGHLNKGEKGRCDMRKTTLTCSIGVILEIRLLLAALFCSGPSPALVISAEPSLRPTSPRLEGIIRKREMGNIQPKITHQWQHFNTSLLSLYCLWFLSLSVSPTTSSACWNTASECDAVRCFPHATNPLQPSSPVLRSTNSTNQLCQC